MNEATKERLLKKLPWRVSLPKLRAALALRSIPMYRAASDARIPPSSLTAMLHGRQRAPRDLAARLALAIGCDVSEITHGGADE